MLQSMGLQRVRLDWTTELNWAWKFPVSMYRVLLSLFSSGSTFWVAVGISNLSPTTIYSSINFLQNHFPFLFSLLQKAMATNSSTLAWKIPWTEEPGRLQSMRSLRVRYNWATSLSLFPFMHWRRKWQPTPVFLPGESQGRGSLVGCHLWGHTESDTTEVT